VKSRNRRHSNHSKDSPTSFPSGGGTGIRDATSSKKGRGAKVFSAVVMLSTQQVFELSDLLSVANWFNKIHKIM
jgi:hypothetical protein